MADLEVQCDDWSLSCILGHEKEGPILEWQSSKQKEAWVPEDFMKPTYLLWTVYWDIFNLKKKKNFCVWDTIISGFLSAEN